MARRKKQPDDQSQENADQNPGSDDTFGLPEIQYEPIKRESPSSEDVNRIDREEEVNQPDYIKEETVNHTNMDRDEVQQNENNPSYYNEDDETSSPWPKILGIIAILLIIGAAVWYFGFEKPKQVAAAKEKAQQEERTRAEASRIEEERLAEQQRLDNEQQKSDSLASAAPAMGNIETLNERTGRYYVVIASAIDGDLIMDYAKKLSQNGVSAKIIPPFGKIKFHRLTIAEGDTYVSTQQTADGLKSEYTSGAWVIKY